MVANKIKGEMMDLQHGQAFLRTVKVAADTGTAMCCTAPCPAAVIDTYWPWFALDALPVFCSTYWLQQLTCTLLHVHMLSHGIVIPLSILTILFIVWVLCNSWCFVSNYNEQWNNSCIWRCVFTNFCVVDFVWRSWLTGCLHWTCAGRRRWK